MSKPVFLNLKKLSDVVNKTFVKKDVYDKLVKKVDFIDTNKLVKKADCDKKISDIERKILSVTGLATTTALTAAENTVPTANYIYIYIYIYIYNKLKSDNLYITLTDYNKFTKNMLDAKLATKDDIADFIKNVLMKD